LSRGAGAAGSHVHGRKPRAVELHYRSGGRRNHTFTMAAEITEEELTRFVTAFYSETVGNGQLTLEKLRALAHAIAPSAIPDTVLKGILQECTKTEPFDFPLMLNMLAERITCPANKEDLLVSFQAFDEDGDGYVTKDELRRVLAGVKGNTLNKDDVDDIVTACDRDGDGKLDFGEVIGAMTE